MSWSNKVHRMLLLWLGIIGENQEAHHLESINNAKKNDRLLITIIIISALASFTSFVNVNDFSSTVQKILTIIVGVFSLLNIILTGIVNEMKLGEISQKNMHAAAEYASISTLIQMTVISPKKPAIEQFLERILDRLTIIQRYSPDIENTTSIADLPNLILIKQAAEKSNRKDPKSFARKKRSKSDIIIEKDADLLMASDSPNHSNFLEIATDNSAFPAFSEKKQDKKESILEESKIAFLEKKQGKKKSISEESKIQENKTFSEIVIN